jgi:ribosome maturation factor RimP
MERAAQIEPAAQIESVIAPSVRAMGFDLIRVRCSGGGSPILQVMAERPDGTMTIEDCAELSRAISALLDVENPIKGRYDLEVSSPGIDRPLVRLADFDRYAGFEVKLETRVPVSDQGGRRKFRGRIREVRGDTVSLECGEALISVPFENIVSAKLVLTDELIKAGLGAK